MSYAHSRGVLHRDLKPANVMLGRYGETLLVDWGLARIANSGEESQNTESEESLVRPRLSGNSSTTLDGQAVGTPAFMSPEQAQGQLEKIGPQSDVYCLGATLYNLLTGEPPLHGEVSEVLSRVISGEIPNARARVSDVPAPLSAVCAKAMALRPIAEKSLPENLPTKSKNT
jgi:serine/threonine protein kinase